MPMKTPPHPGAGLKDDIDALGLSISAAARGLGVSPRRLRGIVEGVSPITPEMAIRLEAGIGGSADHWLRLQLAHDLAKVRETQDCIVVPMRRAS